MRNVLRDINNAVKVVSGFIFTFYAALAENRCVNLRPLVATRQNCQTENSLTLDRQLSRMKSAFYQSNFKGED